LPVRFLLRAAPAPAEILETLTIGRRTQNVLRRFLAGTPAHGAWTYGRLALIPGFGLASLVDVLEAETRARARAPEPKRPDILPFPASSRGRTKEDDLTQAIALVRRVLPASEATIRQRLEAAGIGAGLLDLAQLERAARFARRPVPFAVLRREKLTLAVPAERLTLATALHTLAVRAVLCFGLASARVIAFRAGTEELGFVRRVLSARIGFAWLDRRREWFWYGPEAVAARTLVGRLEAAGARSALAAGARKQKGADGDFGGFLPPRSVLAAAAAQVAQRLRIQHHRDSLG
jgi:hypothetical protein